MQQEFRRRGGPEAGSGGFGLQTEADIVWNAPNGRYLDRYAVSGLMTDETLTPERLSIIEAARLSSGVATVAYYLALPDRTAAERRRGRRVEHALAQSLVAWGERPGDYPSNDDVQRAALRLEWARWYEAYDLAVIERITYVASWALATSHERFGKSALVKLTNERGWVARAVA